MPISFHEILSSVEPILEPIYGPLYRCSLTLRDGMHIPCAVLQSKPRYIEVMKMLLDDALARKRLWLQGADDLEVDPYDSTLSSFISETNIVKDSDIASVEISPYATPPSLINYIQEETLMGWTGWVLEMNDGKRFAYGAEHSKYFVELPDGYGFTNLARVYRHSYLSDDGQLCSLERARRPPDKYQEMKLLRERNYFTCYIDDIERFLDTASHRDDSH